MWNLIAGHDHVLVSDYTVAVAVKSDDGTSVYTKIVLISAGYLQLATKLGRLLLVFRGDVDETDAPLPLSDSQY